MASRSAEEWFELGMECDTGSESLGQAAEAYRKAVEAAPEWVEARINLGTTFYQLGQMENALEQFDKAVQLEPKNALAEFNLGCVFQQLGDLKGAIQHLAFSVELMPALADAHLNLALAANEVQISNAPPNDMLPLARQGRVRILAYTERQRHPDHAREAGIVGYELQMFRPNTNGDATTFRNRL